VHKNEEEHPQKQSKVQNKMQRILDSTSSKKTEKRVVEDPREGLTRRYANYIPIPRYQFVKRIRTRID